MVREEALSYEITTENSWSTLTLHLASRIHHLPSNPPMSYLNLEIWKVGRELSVGIHTMTLAKLAKFEMYEEGAQIRRSVKSIWSNIVEGYGRHRYYRDFIRFLTYAHASCDETVDRLDTLFETQSLTDEKLFVALRARLVELSRKLSSFIQSVET